MEYKPDHEARLNVYLRHLSRLEARLAELEKENERFFWLRLGVLLLGSIGMFVGFFLGPDLLGWVALVGMVAAFIVVVILHRRLDAALLRFRAAQRLAAFQVARLKIDWVLLPPPAIEPPLADLPAHPFERDLNLSGLRSLLHLVDTATSLEGSRRLYSWLLTTDPDPVVIHERQALVKCLAPLTGFRSRLALDGTLALPQGQARWDGRALVKWLEKEPPGRDLRPVLVLLGSLALLNAVLFVLALVGVLPPLWLLPFAVYMVVYNARYRDFNELFEESYGLSRSLEPLHALLSFLERYPYRDEMLKELALPFWSPDQRPSRALHRLRRIASAASLKNNMFLWAPINAVMPWDMFFAHQMNGVKRELRRNLPRWLSRLGEIEALNSLANFAYLHPAYSFPEVEAESSLAGEHPFRAQNLGHPLIPAEARVGNDFHIDRLGQVTIVTGSNMSGKSTFLRTLGINLCLAFAGGPVCASYLATLPFRLFTCINVSDSLSDGISYFYAEVRRLKALLSELQREHPDPLFFLIDEIFRGTNNRERRIGSRSYVLDGLVGARGTGVISTHDLELAHLEAEAPAGDGAGPLIRNVHFREEVIADRLAFDYRLRSGPSPTTNALKIMEMEGLPVRD